MLFIYFSWFLCVLGALKLFMLRCIWFHCNFMLEFYSCMTILVIICRSDDYFVWIYLNCMIYCLIRNRALQNTQGTRLKILKTILLEWRFEYLIRSWSLPFILEQYGLINLVGLQNKLQIVQLIYQHESVTKKESPNMSKLL